MGRASKRLQEHKFKPLASRDRDLQTISFQKAPAKPRSNASFCQNVSKDVEGSRSYLSWIDLMEEGLIFREKWGLWRSVFLSCWGNTLSPVSSLSPPPALKFPCCKNKKKIAIPDFPDAGMDSAYLHQAAPNPSSPKI